MKIFSKKQMQRLIQEELRNILVEVGPEGNVPWCGKSNLNAVEKHICKTLALKTLEIQNLRLWAEFKKAIRNFPNQKQLYSEGLQGVRRFLKERNSCRDTACIKSSYEKRIDEIKKALDAHAVRAMPTSQALAPVSGGPSGSKNIAPSGCPPIWNPPRKRTEVFLEKAEKEQLIVYDKYPNMIPNPAAGERSFHENLRLNMRVRENALMGFVKSYIQRKTNGRIGMSSNVYTSIARSAGTLDKEGMKGMIRNAKKIIDCYLASFNKPKTSPPRGR